MIKKNFLPFSGIIVFFIFIAACAKIGAPSGGPKDVDPPVVLYSTPPNGSKNFTGHSFSVTFDEFVTLDKVNEKLMVSPPLKKRPTITLKNKSVVVKFQDTLKTNTTYSFYFQDAIRDLNESNPINDFQYCFSTGDFIDSLSVSGNIYQSLSLDFPDHVLVALYKNLDDTAFCTQLPYYLSKTNQKGYFNIEHVHEGEYRLYALKDADNSKNFNNDEEEIAFIDSVITVTSASNYMSKSADTAAVKSDSLKNAGSQKMSPAAHSSTGKGKKHLFGKSTKGAQGASAGRLSSKEADKDTVFVKGMYEMYLFSPEKTKSYLVSSTRNSPYKLEYALSIPPKDHDFSFAIPGSDSSKYAIEMNGERDSMSVWLIDSSLYNVQLLKTILNYPFTDSSGNIVTKTDSLTMRYIPPKQVVSRGKKSKQNKKDKYVLSATKNGLYPSQVFKLTSPTPFRPPDTAKIKLFEIVDSVKKAIPFSFSIDSTNSCSMSLIAELLENKKYVMTADSAAFGDIYRHNADSTGYNINVKSSEDFATLSFNLSGYRGGIILELLNNNKVVRSKAMNDASKKVTFKYLNKGKYAARVIYDINGDGKWTTGSFRPRRQPEPSSYLTMQIDLLPNFENIIDWDISVVNYKKDRSVQKTKK